MKPVAEFQLKMFEKAKDKPVEVLESSLKLYDNHLRYKLEYWSETPVDYDDPSFGWETTLKSMDTVMKRGLISAIDKTIDKYENYQVSIYTDNAYETIHFETSDEAEKIFNELLKWWLND